MHSCGIEAVVSLKTLLQSGNVRTLTEEDGTILFCGKDVAEALGYSRPHEAIKDHCQGGAVKRRIPTKCTNQYGAEYTMMNELSFITEPDLYRLIVASKLPSAQKFERWVFDGGLIKHPVRIVEKDGEPWWIAKDVCAYFGDTNYRRSITNLAEDEKGVSQIDTPGGIQSMTVISEAGLYSLILRSRKPQAKAFQRWAIHEVFPAIRKTGRGYRLLQNTTPTERKVNYVFTYEKISMLNKSGSPTE